MPEDERVSQPGAEPTPEFGTDAAMRAFARQPTRSGAVFDDRLLATYRHPRERLGLSLGVALLLVTVGGASLFSWVAGVAAVSVLLLTALITRLTAAQQLAHAAEVTPTQFAHLYPMVRELRDRFSMPRTRVFVAQSPLINAVSLGFRAPYVIVLNSALVDALDRQELKSVLGHEMGHIKFGHTRLGLLLGGMDARDVVLPFPINLVARLRDVIFLWWERCTEMTADRAGIIACGRPSKAISAQVKVSVGPTLLEHVNFDDLARQAADLQTGLGRIESVLSQLGASHPYLINRIGAMLEFVSMAQTDGADLLDHPALPRRARLVARSGHSDARAYTLDGRRLVAGRSPSADVQVNDRAASRRHFEIVWEEPDYVVRDLGSHNGTFLNGERIASANLRDGDTVRLGCTELAFSASSDF
ncbi:MAG: M48 family metalloprotease [Chloroflexota bacterium]